ncbi:SIMPL domain-containing protein [Ideonella sp.]|uniref:SIMPL domain-containing protein n=1 Tax=Ideonella sp. TaxID=1929293 RepID=UPI0035B1F161
MTPASSLRTRPLALTAAALALAVSTAHAQAEPPLQGVLNLSASATAEVPQDWMTVTLSVTRQGTDARVVQTQLKQAVDAALGEARKEARPGQVELQTGSFSIEPRYGQKGQLLGWDGSTQLLIQGRDMPSIAQLSGRISTMTIAGVDYSISREARQKVADELSSQAVARFRARAADLAKDFGYAGYVVREVNVQTQEHGEPPRPRMYAAAAMAESAKALPVEAGKGTVSVSVSGSVQMK